MTVEKLLDELIIRHHRTWTLAEAYDPVLFSKAMSQSVICSRGVFT
jgi:hypothetical protein